MFKSSPWSWPFTCVLDSITAHLYCNLHCCNLSMCCLHKCFVITLMFVVQRRRLANVAFAICACASTQMRTAASMMFVDFEARIYLRNVVLREMW